MEAEIAPELIGSMPSRRTTETVLALRQSMAKYWEGQKALYILIIDLEKAIRIGFQDKTLGEISDKRWYQRSTSVWHKIYIGMCKQQLGAVLRKQRGWR